MAGGIKEGDAIKEQLLLKMEAALAGAGVSEEKIALLKKDYFNVLDKAIFENPILANWRHQQSLDYLRKRVDTVLRHTEEAVGSYSEAKRTAALNRYCEKSLATWDIIDLSNLPEGDIHLATQQLLLRQLYMPLRIEFEPTKATESYDVVLADFEKQREFRRHREAGHQSADTRKGLPNPTSRVPVGERLKTSRRLVVLGDPGGGKTTMLRWMATAYLLRQKSKDDFIRIPDAETLPSQPWIPVLIRCRDLGEADLCRSFADFLTQHLNKTELLPEEASIMRAVILDRIVKGEALLLVDGLDEITDPRVRVNFCQELERTAARYPAATIVVTSRIVGYRDMPYRMGSGFEHGFIAELDGKDKDLFVKRWVEVTEHHQSSSEKAKRAQELSRALHSSSRIQQLTGNPLLLTTLALVKRKVGKLPTRRNKLYSEAVSVLLNWNPLRYEIIDDDEAIPQLEYLAYEMCRRGVQRLTNEEVLDLLDRLRTEYRNVRALGRRGSQDFLALLEARSSILIKSGGIWRNSRTKEQHVWEFRHLTFQEYLAARALSHGRYPGRDKTKTLAAQVAPLACPIMKGKRPHPNLGKNGDAFEVPESWREALRLLVADCRDDDVDDVLLAILNTMADEDSATTGRPRAVLAALCLADEPNISETCAEQVLRTLAGNVGEGDGGMTVETPLDQAVAEVTGSIWFPQFKKAFILDFCQRSPDSRWHVGSVFGMAELNRWRRSGIDKRTFLDGLEQPLRANERLEFISASLTIMTAAYVGGFEVSNKMAAALMDLLEGTDYPSIHAAAWALGWITRGSPYVQSPPSWRANSDDVRRIGQVLDAAPSGEISVRRWLLVILGHSSDPRALSLLVRYLDDSNTAVCLTAIQSAGFLGNKQAVLPLLAKMGQYNDAPLRVAVIEALLLLGDSEIVQHLVSYLNDEDLVVRKAVVNALRTVGNAETVPSLLPKLDDVDPGVRQATVTALAKLGRTQAFHALLAKLDDPDLGVRTAVIELLGRIGDKKATLALLEKLGRTEAEDSIAIIEALGLLGDERAVLPLLPRLASHNKYVAATAAAALNVLGDARGSAILNLMFASEQIATREIAVWAFALMKDDLVKQLLSQDLDGLAPWIDPKQLITEDRLAKAADELRITPQQVRSRYEAMAGDLGLKIRLTGLTLLDGDGPPY